MRLKRSPFSLLDGKPSHATSIFHARETLKQFFSWKGILLRTTLSHCQVNAIDASYIANPVTNRHFDENP